MNHISLNQYLTKGGFQDFLFDIGETEDQISFQTPSYRTKYFKKGRFEINLKEEQVMLESERKNKKGELIKYKYLRPIRKELILLDTVVELPMDVNGLIDMKEVIEVSKRRYIPDIDITRDLFDKKGHGIVELFRKDGESEVLLVDIGTIEKTLELFRFFEKSKEKPEDQMFEEYFLSQFLIFDRDEFDRENSMIYIRYTKYNLYDLLMKCKEYSDKRDEERRKRELEREKEKDLI